MIAQGGFFALGYPGGSCRLFAGGVFAPVFLVFFTASAVRRVGGSGRFWRRVVCFGAKDRARMILRFRRGVGIRVVLPAAEETMWHGHGSHGLAVQSEL